VGDGLTIEQGADNVRALAQACIPLSFLGPGDPGQIFIQTLAVAQGQPEAAWIHLTQSCRRMRENDRVISIVGRRNDPEGEGSRLRAAPRQDQASPDYLWAGPHGRKWSEDIAQSKPAASAACTGRRSSEGANCSWEA
jgi:hypothetical protein